MDAVEKRHQDITTLCNITYSLYNSLCYQQIICYTPNPSWSNLWDSLYYMREVAIWTMDYIDVAPTGILSPHVLPIKDLREMLSYIKEMLPSSMHLTISSEDALHFYRYLCTHVLIADEQFLLMIDVPIWDHVQ